MNEQLGRILLSPPAAFITMLVFMLLLSRILSIFAFRPKKRGEGMTKSYACGEDVQTHLIQPEYGDFFPFAFFFTILHVVALMITTVPIERVGTFSLALIYILGAITGLLIIFRR